MRRTETQLKVCVVYQCGYSGAGAVVRCIACTTALWDTSFFNLFDLFSLVLGPEFERLRTLRLLRAESCPKVVFEGREVLEEALHKYQFIWGIFINWGVYCPKCVHWMNFQSAVLGAWGVDCANLGQKSGAKLLVMNCNHQRNLQRADL